MSLYLYAILNAADLNLVKHVHLKGMNQQPVRFQPLGSFAIAYSEAQQERYLASRANLLTHEATLEALMQAIDPERAVPLPLQFGLVVADWEQVQSDLLEPHHASLETLLKKLAGKREVSIKLFWDRLAELNLILAEQPDLQRQRDELTGKPLTMDEAIAIGQQLEQALEERQQAIIDMFLRSLQPLCHEYVIGELLTDNMLYNAAFLIDWTKEPEFAREVEKLDAQFENRLRIRYNNFTAPYNFVKLD